MTELAGILKEISEYSNGNNRRALTIALRKIMGKRREYYHQIDSAHQLEKYIDALYKILLLEIDEDENESIETAELAYLGICTLIKSPNSSSAYYKLRILLLHYFSDYFTDAIIEVFLKKYQKENFLQARNLAIECLEKMQWVDIFYLEENDPDFIDHDEQLNDACNTTPGVPDLSEEERNNAVLLHKVTHAYLVAKYKN